MGQRAMQIDARRKRGELNNDHNCNNSIQEMQQRILALFASSVQCEPIRIERLLHPVKRIPQTISNKFPPFSARGLQKRHSRLRRDSTSDKIDLRFPGIVESIYFKRRKVYDDCK